MAANPNALQWDGGAGHYEVYYLSATDRATGCGLWIRYTMVAPAAGAGEPTCSLWFMAMDPERREVRPTTGKRGEADKHDHPERDRDRCRRPNSHESPPHAYRPPLNVHGGH